MRRRTFSRSGDPERHAVSGPDGRFLLQGLPAGATTWEVRALLPGFAPARVTLAQPAAGAGRRDLRLVLVPGRTGVGRVLDRAEQPVAGAEVTLRATTGEMAPEGGDAAERRRPGAEGIDFWKASSDAAGHFTLAGLPAGRVDLLVARPGFVPVTVRALAIPGGSGPLDLGTVILEPGVEIQGLVLGGEGRPIEKASVFAGKDLQGLRFQAEAGRAPGRRPDATTGPEGRFVLSNLRRGERVELWVSAPGFLPAAVDGITAPNAKPLRVVLERGARVTGRVVDAEGVPVAGAELSLTMERHGEERGLIRFAGGARSSARSAADGRFEVPPVPPGRGRLLIEAEGFQPLERKDLAVPAEGLAGLELVLDRGAVLEGRVRTEDGEPVEDARVVCGAAAAISDADGAYRLDGVVPGPRTARLLHREFPPLDKDLVIQPGLNHLDLILAVGHEVAGQVVDREGRPVAGAALALYPEGSPREQITESGDDGAFSFPRVVDGSYTLRTEKVGYRTVETPQAVRLAGSPLRGLEVRLDRGTRLHGGLPGLDLYDLSEVEVRATRDDGSGERPGRVSSDGTYEVLDLPPGDWQVTASLRGGTRSARRRVLIEPGLEEVRVDLEFGRALTLTGSVLFGREPLSGARLTLRGLDVSGFRAVTTGFAGDFRLEDLHPGKYRLQVLGRQEMLNHAEDLRLDADREILVDIAAARVAGTVIDAATGEPLDGAIVGLRRLEGTEVAFLIAIGTDEQGDFALPSVTEGHYRMTVTKDGYAPQDQEVEVFLAAGLEDLRVALNPAAGLDLDVRLAAGGRPAWVRAAVLDTGGRVALFEVRSPDAATGLFRLPNLAPGTWEILLLAPESAPAAVRVKVPGKPVPVTLSPGGRLTVRLPSLVAAEHKAVLTLTRADGTPFRAPSPYGTLEDLWMVDGGKAVVEGVPAGTWLLRATVPDGRFWERTITTAGADAEVRLE
ncbi:MAG TPA: hypothetical protein DD490_11475 [Acidobacteria bacterium]|nr:hypothetical protein [Acidobacteriota bacterium]